MAVLRGHDFGGQIVGQRIHRSDKSRGLRTHGGVCVRRQVQQVHRGRGPGFSTRVLAVQVAIATSRAWLDLLTLDTRFGTSLTGMRDTASTW